MSDEWSVFGKVCAGIAATAALGGGLYWVGARIYDSGRVEGRFEGQAEVNERWQRENSALVESGRLIPKEECFHYHSSKEGSGVEGCGFTLTYDGNKKSVELIIGGYMATLSPREAPSLARKVQAMWVNIPTQ